MNSEERKAVLDSGETGEPGASPRDDRLHDLLVKTSRTFALAIPELPQPTLREVTVAYLLFRIADTFEDASVLWPRKKRVDALAEFDQLLSKPSVQQASQLADGWLADPPTDHSGYLELLGETSLVFTALLGLETAAREAIIGHTRKTTQLMSDFVLRADADGVLRLEDLGDLRAYCYAVAGIVGEMLTDLFVIGSKELSGSVEFLRQRATAFGEGLQLVNILKDSAADADEGRNFLPSEIDRSELFDLARADLQSAAEYAREIQRAGGPAGVVAFTALPVELAWATLDRVEQAGPGAKITRARVFALYNKVRRAIRKGRPVLERSVAASEPSEAG